MKSIYTIGYTCFCLDEFVSMLKKYRITCIIDVRSTPLSKFYPDYNKESLSRILERESIYYRNYTTEFGARQTSKSFFSNDGYLDFEKFRSSAQFKSGLSRLMNGMDKGYVFALMCAEKDPINCHRNLMIACEFHRLGYEVRNILCDGSYELQESIENRLVNMYFPNRDQISLFSENDEIADIESLIKKAYKLRNADIGFKLEGE